MSFEVRKITPEQEVEIWKNEEKRGKIGYFESDPLSIRSFLLDGIVHVVIDEKVTAGLALSRYLIEHSAKIEELLGVNGKDRGKKAKKFGVKR